MHSTKKDPVSSYRPRVKPWAAGMAVGILIGIALAILFATSPGFAISFILVGLATGAGFAISFQALADDRARKR